MVSLNQCLLLALTSISIVLGLPGGSGDYGSPTITYGSGGSNTENGGAQQTCSVYTINSYTYISQPITSIETSVSSVTEQTTVYIPCTTTSTINAGGLVSQTITETVPTGSWVTSFETTVITTSSWESTNVEVATVVVSSVGPVVTEIVGSTASVVETCYPTTVYETIVGYTQVETNIPVTTTSCSSPSNYGWRK